MNIRPFRETDMEAIVELSLRAWAPVFASLEREMPPDVYRAFHPEGWRASQRAEVEAVCADSDQHVWVAEEGAPLGFVAVRLHPEGAMGEIYMVAVDPDRQRRGIGTALTEFALEWMKDAGMTLAMVETGGDPGHAPARRTYQRTGFSELSIVRFFRTL